MSGALTLQELRAQVIALTQDLMGRQRHVIGQENDLENSLREAADALRHSPEVLVCEVLSF